MLTYHQMCSVAFTWEQFHKKCLWNWSSTCVTILHFLNYHHISQNSSKASRHFEAWCRHHMETFSALLALCAGNSPVTGVFSAQRPVTRSFDVSFELRLNKWLSKQSWGWWFETPTRLLWRHCNASPPLALITTYVRWATWCKGHRRAAVYCWPTWINNQRQCWQPDHSNTKFIGVDISLETKSRQDANFVVSVGNCGKNWHHDSFRVVLLCYNLN